VFDFWVQLLETQRGLAHSWLAAATSGGLAAEPLVEVSARTAPASPRAPGSSTTGSSTTASSTPARTAASTADEKVSAAASDAVARAAGLTAAKTRP
jgi:hypothetical protein